MREKKYSLILEMLSFTCYGNWNRVVTLLSDMPIVILCERAI